MLPENLSRKVAMLTADPTIAFVHSAVEFLIEATAPNPPLNWIDNAVEDCVLNGNTYFYKLLFQQSHLCSSGSGATYTPIENRTI